MKKVLNFIAVALVFVCLIGFASPALAGEDQDQDVAMSLLEARKVAGGKTEVQFSLTPEQKRRLNIAGAIGGGAIAWALCKAPCRAVLKGLLEAAGEGNAYVSMGERFSGGAVKGTARKGPVQRAFEKIKFTLTATELASDAKWLRLKYLVEKADET